VNGLLYTTIQLASTGGVATITLNRPQRLNALNAVMIGELRHALKAVTDSPALRCLLLTGTGRGFCAGADLVEPGGTSASGRDTGDVIAERMDAMWNPLMRDLAALPIPVVVAVNGPAAGGGVGLALTGDIVIAAKSAYFAMVFGPQLGLVPDLGSSWLVPHLAGLGRAAALALTGERFSAKAAAATGLIWRCTEDAALLPEATRIAERLSRGPTAGLKLIKQALAQSWQNSLEQQLGLERELQRQAGDTADFVEGVAAFQAKRQPIFKGQ